MKITLAKLEHAEVLSQFFQQVHDESFEHDQLFSAQTIAELIRAEEMAIVIAAHQRAILGCGVAFLYPWNQSLRIGPISVDQIDRRAEVTKALFKATLRLGLKKHGVVYLRVSTQKEFRRVKKMGAACWGFRPSPNSRRVTDAELIMGFPHPSNEKKRVEAPLNSITRTPFATRIIEKIKESEQGIPYPKNYPVGCPQGTGAPMISGRVWPTYHSKGNYIEIENAAGAYPVEIIKEFKERVQKKGVRDLRLTIPVNQEEAYFELLSYGFSPVAYLPSWFLRGAHRFDCVKLAAGLPRMPREPDTFVERAVVRIFEELEA